MTRVLHVSAGNLFGGVEKFLTTLASYQHVADLEHHFAVCFDGRLSSELENLKSNPHRLGGVRISRPWTVIAARRRFSELLASQRFDAVITHLAWPHVLFARVAQRAGLPVVFYAHNPLTKSGWLDRWAARSVPDQLIGCSQHTTRSYAKIFPDVPATTIYLPHATSSPAEASSRDAIRRSLNTSIDDVVIVQVSRMERWKGHDQLLRALSQLKTESRWRCWIVGGAQRPAEIEYFKELRALCDRLSLNDRVHFVGERNDVPNILAAADIFCQANRVAEGLGIVFMEAFAAKLPVITMRLGPAEEIVAEGCGILVEPRDTARFAAAIDRAIDDRALREQMGAAGHAHLQEFSNPLARLSELENALQHAIIRVAAKVPLHIARSIDKTTTANRFA